MSNSRPTPDLATVITDAIAAAARFVRVALPASVQSYDAATQTCSAQPLVQDGLNDETGTRRAVRVPIVTNVPVVFPGAGAYSITWPLAAGDTVLLVFASSAIDRWLAYGGEVDPLDDRKHHLTDAIAIAGLRDLTHALGPTGTDSGALVVSAPMIKLGDATADTAPATVADLTALLTAISGAAVLAGDGGATFKAAIVTALSPPVATWPSGAANVLVKKGM